MNKFWLWSLPLTALGLLLLRLLPVDFFVKNDIPLCLFRLFFNWHCPGCGSLRALSYLVYGDWLTAWQYNRLIFFELLTLILVNFYYWGAIGVKKIKS